jgi:hypothetical protein
VQANIGDTLHIFGTKPGVVARVGEIIEVHGEQGAPPYLVRFADGKEELVFPGPDARVEPAARRS